MKSSCEIINFASILLKSRYNLIEDMIFKNDLILRTMAGESVERPPVWLMRQAGRILPQYRELRSSLRDFKELVETPDKAAEVTIQPIDELGVDAAIIFSDILVIPDAMGLPYEMEEKVGPVFPAVIQTEKDVDALISGIDAAEQLGYVYDALSLTKQRLDGRVPLIGFSGAPWTLFAYMMEGKGSKTFSTAKSVLYRNPEMAHKLLGKLTDSIIEYLKLQIIHGADIIQIFDSWAGLLSPEQYRKFSIKYIKRICDEVSGVPITIFSKGAWFALGELAALPCQTLGVDWTTPVSFVRSEVGSEIILQGNMDPCQLYAPVEDIEKNTLLMIESFGRNHVVNLGHGVYPDTPLAGVKEFVNTVKKFRYI